MALQTSQKIELISPVYLNAKESPYRWRDLQRAQLKATMALDQGARRDAYALRYQSYLAEGHIDPNGTGLFHDSYDEHATSQTVVLYRSGVPVASARLSGLGTAPEAWDDGCLPAARVFPDQVRALRGQGGGRNRIVEVARLVRHPQLGADQGVVFALFQVIGYLVTEIAADVVLSCVRRNHMAFYTRLCFEPVAGPRRYPGVKFDAHLMACARPRFGEVTRQAPLLALSGSQRAQYVGLMRGAEIVVPVGAASP